MKLLTAAEILAKDDSQHEDVSCPEWGGTVRIRSLTADEREAFDESVTRVIVTGKGRKSAERQEVDRHLFKSKLVASSAVDEAGNRLFTDAQAEQLGKKNAAALDRCFAVAQRLSGLTNEDVEDLAGKSDPATTSSSSTS